VKFEDGVRCKPSTATLNKEETELNKMLEFALDKGYISQKPSIKKTKVKSNRHPHFTKPEFRKLVRKLRMFIEASPNASIRQQRVLMYSAIAILVGTGLRPHELMPDAEKASKGLKWKDVRIVDNDEKVGKKYVKIHIHKLNSKTGKARDVYASGSVHWHFTRLREKLDTRWVEIQKIFNSDFRRSFKSFLTWANMRTNAEGENYCMYSFRHSYATWKIEAGVPIKQLADVMGNSVAIIEKHYSHALTANFKENFI
jgi:integrase